jgi:pyrroline-5-carboxylate reductase
MATAIARGLVAADFAKATQIAGSDPSDDCRRRFTTETGAPASADNPGVARASILLILAVKPQHMPAVLREIAPHLEHRPLIVSVAAGVPLSQMLEVLGENQRLIRVMPNTPCLVQAGAAAFARGGQATPDDARLVESLFSTIGIAFELPESLLDAVTGLSGSGPAYAFQIIEALSDGGVAAGLPRDVSTHLAAQTLLGAARMVLETGEHPGALKDAVASPGGTTIAGLHELERGGLRGTLMNAVVAATLRSKELGQLQAGK